MNNAQEVPLVEKLRSVPKDYCYALERENKALNEKYDDCVRQLTEAHAKIDRFDESPLGWWHKEVEDLREQLASQGEALAAALAACKGKDDELEQLRSPLNMYKLCGD